MWNLLPVTILGVISGLLLIKIVLGFFALVSQLNTIELIATGVVTLFATFGGVFFAESLTRKRERARDKQIFRAYLKYLINEIYFNYEQLKQLCEHFEVAPPDKRGIIAFINKQVEDFKDEVFLAFISSGAVASYVNDDLDNAMQQMYTEIWRLKTGSKLSADIFIDPSVKESSDEQIKGMGEQVFLTVKSSAIRTKEQMENSMFTITRRLKKEGLTFRVDHGNTSFELTNEQELRGYINYVPQRS